MNRWQLNFKRNVGAVAEEIRKCEPKAVEDWESYYYSKVYPKAHLDELGARLYVKVTEVLVAEIDSITEEDCIHYIKDVVINRTFDGYQSEIQTIFGQLKAALGVDIEPAPDHWDRHYNVDFFIKVDDHYIGLRIKPVGHAYITQIIKEQQIQARSHISFNAKYGGPVFYVYSIKQGDKKVIYNPEVIEKIQAQIHIYRSART